MYASVRQYAMGKGSLDALAHRVDNEFAPAIGQGAGFVAYFMLDTGAGTPTGTRGMAYPIWPFADGCQPPAASLSTRGVPGGSAVRSTPEGRLAPLRGWRA